MPLFWVSPSLWRAELKAQRLSEHSPVALPCTNMENWRQRKQQQQHQDPGTQRASVAAAMTLMSWDTSVVWHKRRIMGSLGQMCPFSIPLFLPLITNTRWLIIKWRLNAAYSLWWNTRWSMVPSGLKRPLGGIFGALSLCFVLFCFIFAFECSRELQWKLVRWKHLNA